MKNPEHVKDCVISLKKTERIYFAELSTHKWCDTDNKTCT